MYEGGKDDGKAEDGNRKKTAIESSKESKVDPAKTDAEAGRNAKKGHEESKQQQETEMAALNNDKVAQ